MEEEIYYKIPSETLKRLLHNVAAIDTLKREHRKEYELLRECVRKQNSITEVNALLESFKDLILKP